MSHELEPTVGRWYRNVDREQLFKVVGIDEDDELIEILHFDGDREKIDTGAWIEMDLETAEAPEDWIDPDDSDEEDDDYEEEADVEDDTDWGRSRRRHRPPREDWEEDEEDWDDDGDGDD
jgi:Family of unknown function (DUF6763)